MRHFGELLSRARGIPTKQTRYSGTVADTKGRIAAGPGFVIVIGMPLSCAWSALRHPRATEAEATDKEAREDPDGRRRQNVQRGVQAARLGGGRTSSRVNLRVTVDV